MGLSSGRITKTLFFQAGYRIKAQIMGIHPPTTGIALIRILDAELTE